MPRLTLLSCSTPQGKGLLQLASQGDARTGWQLTRHLLQGLLSLLGLLRQLCRCRLALPFLSCSFLGMGC